MPSWLYCITSLLRIVVDLFFIVYMWHVRCLKERCIYVRLRMNVSDGLPYICVRVYLVKTYMCTYVGIKSITYYFVRF